MAIAPLFVPTPHSRFGTSRAGLAGLRLGYGIAHKDLVKPMMAIKQPYNVNTASEVAGLAGE